MRCLCTPCYPGSRQIYSLHQHLYRSFWYLQRNGASFSSLALGFGDWPDLDNELLFKAQSVYFFTLVLMQWG